MGPPHRNHRLNSIYAVRRSIQIVQFETFQHELHNASSMQRNAFFNS